MPALNFPTTHCLVPALFLGAISQHPRVFGALDADALLRVPALSIRRDSPNTPHVQPKEQPPPFPPGPDPAPAPAEPPGDIAPNLALDLQNVLIPPDDSGSSPLLPELPEDEVPDEFENPPFLLNPAPETKPPVHPHFWNTSIPAGNAATLPALDALTEFSALQIEGPLRLRFQLNSAVVGDDNITLSARNKKKDLLLSLGPSAAASLGSDDTPFRLALSYAGAGVAFLKNPGQRSYDQIANITGGWNGSKLRVSLRGGAQHMLATTTDVGDRIGRRIYYGGIHFAYALGEKFSTEWSGDATHASFQSQLRSNEYRTQSFLQYQCTPKIRVGTGYTFGVLLPERGERQTYLQALLRALYIPTAKLTIDAQMGADVRRYQKGRSQSSSPVFSAVATWAATAKTQISMEARRRIFASSALESQNYTVTGFSIALQHLLSETLSAGMTTGYEHAAYSATRPHVQSDRRDQYGFLRLSLNWSIHRRITLGSFYELGRNLSTGIQSREFTRNRVGLSANVMF